MATYNIENQRGVQTAPTSNMQTQQFATAWFLLFSAFRTSQEISYRSRRLQWNDTDSKRLLPACERGVIRLLPLDFHAFSWVPQVLHYPLFSAHHLHRAPLSIFPYQMQRRYRTITHGCCVVSKPCEAFSQRSVFPFPSLNLEISRKVRYRLQNGLLNLDRKCRNHSSVGHIQIEHM